MVLDLSLRAVQERFYAVVVAPEGVGPGMAELGLAPADLDPMIVGDERLSAVERLDLYANMYFFRLLDVLRGDFPRTLSVIGDAKFHNLATDYLAARAPAHPSIRNVGDRLADFLASHTPAECLPWIADLAALEWARTDVHDAADSEPLSMPEFEELAGEAFADLPLALVPAHRVLRLSFRVDEVWRALEHEGAVPPTVDATPTGLIVWRRGNTIWHRPIDEEEAHLLDRVRAGDRLAHLCEWLGANRGVEEAASVAFGYLARWVSDGLLARDAVIRARNLARALGVAGGPFEPL